MQITPIKIPDDSVLSQTSQLSFYIQSFMLNQSTNLGNAGNARVELFLVRMMGWSSDTVCKNSHAKFEDKLMACLSANKVSLL